MVQVRLEPQGKDLEFHGVKTVLGLLNRLELRPTAALIIRDGCLLTPDERIYNNQSILVRIVTSAG